MSNDGYSVRIKNRHVDLTYWLFVTPFVTGGLTRLATLGAFGVLALYIPRPELALSIWIELPFALLVADIVGYWSHRLRHCGVLWYFHAIHHSPTRLDALAAARMHPVDDLIDNTLVGVSLFMCGFSVPVIFAIGPILFAHIALIHANVTWDFGPLKKVFVSPVHHRLHHEIGESRNYSGMFSFIDVIFGTYATTSSGVHGTSESIPTSLTAHFLWPFRKIGIRPRH